MQNPGWSAQRLGPGLPRCFGRSRLRSIVVRRRQRVQLVVVRCGCQCPLPGALQRPDHPAESQLPCVRFSVALSPGAARHANRACRARKGGLTPAGNATSTDELRCLQEEGCRWARQPGLTAEKKRVAASGERNEHRRVASPRPGWRRRARPSGPQLTGWTTTGLLSQTLPSRGAL